MIQALKLLFRSSDYICVGDKYATLVGPQPIKPVTEFFSLNPLSATVDHVKGADGAIRGLYGVPGRRADLNVTRFQNFLFEMDNTPLSTQIAYIRDSGFPFATVTYSGGKSYHAIISLEVPMDVKAHTPEAVDEYKLMWKRLATVFCQRLNQPLTLLDSACQNPSRLTRLPGSVRDNGVVQHLEHLGSLCSPEQLANLLAEAPDIKRPQRVVVTGVGAGDEEEMKLMMPVALLSRFKFPKTWASGTGAGNYQSLLKLVLWAIDATGVSQETLTTFMEQNTFPFLLKTGYPADKIYKAINDAYSMKGNS